MDDSPAIKTYKEWLGTTKALKMTTYKTEYLLQLAYAAYRVNNGYQKHTRRYSEDKPTTYSNKELVAYTASYHNEQSPYIPDDFIPLVVTDEDRSALEAGKKHMRRYTMLAMGDLPDFEADMFSAYSSDEMPIGRIGILAYLPAFIERQVKDKVYKSRLKQEFGNSKHLVVDPIEGNCEILKVIRVSRDFDEPFYMHFGAIDGNLVCFARKEGYAEGITYAIKAKVKGQEKERETGLPMTRINYVKLRKTEA